MSGLCSVCGAADLSVGGDGFSYCNVCGSQSQFYQDQAFDYDDTHVYNARNVRERGIARKESQLATQELQNTLATQASQLATEDDLAFFQSSQFQSQYQSQFGDDILPFAQSVKHSQIPGNPQSDIEDLGLTESEKLAARVRKVYVEGVQMLVQMQCEALVQSFGVTPLVCGILGPVWMKFVRSTCVYEKGWAEEALLVAEAQHEKSDKEDTEDENNALAGLELDKDEKPVISKEVKPRRKKRVVGEPWTTYGERTRFVWLRSLKARIPLRSSLAITYLVCHLAREPILPTDIINWAFEGTLPYLSAYTAIEKRSNWIPELQLFKASKIFKPLRMTNARVVEYLASLIGDRIGLELPPINFHAISRRFLKELDLPVEKLAPYVCRLYEWFPSSGLWLTSQVSKVPTRVYVMAALVVVFKILYNLDGRYRLSSKDFDAVSGDDESMDTLEVRKEEQWNAEEFVTKIKLLLHNDINQVDDQEQLTDYLRYCRETIFANDGMSNDEDLRDYFWGIYEQSAKQGSLRGTISKESQNTESDIGTNGLLLLDSEENSFYKQSKPGKKSKKTSSKLQTDPLLRGMEDLGFCIIDPPKHVPRENEYWTYVITRDDMRPVHEDYLFVLRACAKIIDVDPRVLHMAILNVEKGIIKVEKRTSKFHDKSFNEAGHGSE
ncbi:TATA box-binding protein-associated factor RNA polymerase I subunit B isoform X1 [Physcomitrium patens]|uniref:RRN7-type domain-containing protein n=1 Tax=Physcomitrium patens TaxID=3218 RepID=A0A2K1K2H6_PHYPA|nr:TATA box-binding protein-associated factor RNA polymerase I subunit B-like isoform X1 [Physcomitrium patens]XP_024385013.1 TATA box-binding protein-associated factor RNA polymerase I subunit B-like isoform X1 [Physcomitrium patens]XP_024385014.1 TATA box-binding protein-associated factor RNA polymerase I subunit B-like isoform X1 [Physcomitrium patens]XP_024385015.1 TATA box-binding protein-associated factor RNA polymerase I subunit B-like isoform X1 [Physcomitrium patens]XP_024385016.1 TATA|eukprot:XP_024385012.1 TATA box-binding protein-associated factor RNA polymerase I subunit B-like isoform X1 [Physcomitrella patens]